MNDVEQHLTELRVFGFTIVEDVLAPAQVDAMREFVVDAEERIGVEMLHRGTARHLANLVALDPMFFDVIDHERVLPLIEMLMGPDLILGSLNARVVRSGDGAQSLHSDVPLPLHHYGEAPPVMMNTVWPLHDFTPDNGGTRVVPGSHNSRLEEPPAGFEIPFEVQPEVAAGSVIVFNGQTWHGGGENRTPTKRAAMFGHYRFGEWMRFQCDPHHEFRPEWLQLLNLRQRQLLRMENGISSRHGADYYER
ncbi:MAG: phytanoyl-CoA dioxygenase family protein [Actinomycetota bacterium]